MWLKIFGRTNRSGILKVNTRPISELFWVFISFVLAGGESTNSEEECDFSPPLLFCSQYLGLGLGLGLHFWGRDLQRLGMFLVSAEFWGSVWHPQGVLCTQQVPGAWHLAQVCRAGAQPQPAPRTGNSCFKKQRWEHPLGHLRIPTPWDTDQTATIPLLQIISSIPILQAAL